MKKIILLFFILAGTIHLHGQEYVPLIDSTRIWNVAWYGGHGGGPENWEYYFGDTISIEDTLYIEVFAKIDWWIELKGYLREDTVSKKVYIRNIFAQEPALLYDFSLEEGDTIQLYGNPFSHTVLQVDSIELQNGVFRKRLMFSYNAKQSENVIWIEGIGNTTVYLLNPGDSEASTGRTIMLCCYENGELVYMNKEFNICKLDWVSVDEAIEPIVKVYPNPFNQKLSISFENPVFGEKHEIMIKALDGRVVYKETLNSDISLDLSFLSKGIYLLVLTNRDFQYTTKIIKL